MKENQTNTVTRKARREWIPSEINFLRENYSKGAKFVAETLGRDIASIYQKATKIGLKSGTAVSSSASSMATSVRPFEAPQQQQQTQQQYVPAEPTNFQASAPTTKQKYYMYHCSIDGQADVDMISERVINANSIVFLNTNDFRIRCFVKNSEQMQDGSFSLMLQQTSLAPVADLYEPKRS